MDLSELKLARDRVCARLNFGAKASRENPIADFSIINSQYVKAYRAVYGVDPEFDEFDRQAERRYTIQKYGKRKVGETKAKPTKLRGKGSIAAQVGAGQADMFAQPTAAESEVMKNDLIEVIPLDEFSFDED